MDFGVSVAEETFRQEARAFAETHVTDEVVSRAYRTGTMHDWGLHRALAERGWIAAPWPIEDGGLAMGAFQTMILLDELQAARAPLDGWVTTMCGTNALRDCGTEMHRRDVVSKVVAGEALISLGFSEPDAGSDVAAVRTRAIRDGSEWVINGQKMFTTMAHEARWVFLLTRTGAPDSKHRGLTMFLVPLDDPGVEVQPVHTLGGERTNITFYNDVRIGDEWRVGEVDGGWDVLTLALNHERGSAFGAGSSFLGTSRKVLESACTWARTRDADGNRAFDDPAARLRIGSAAVLHEVARLLNHRTIWMAERGQPPMVEAAMAKLFATETLQRSCSDLLDLLGPEGLLPHGHAGAPADGELEHAYRHGAVTTIYGGSSEVLRGLIASRGLRLPR
jgi:alkylation response protein AidB-like acyl-CoA dehydrogenase